MLIGNKYSDNKMYRGIRFYDKLPMLSEDMHEYSDTVFMKNAYIMNNIIGHGALNSPNLTISALGIRLNEPVVLLIDGDISLIQSDDNSDIVNIDSISQAGYESGVICIVGWYQHITSHSTLKNYGGVENSTIENDLLNEEFKVQISTRYQFRWFPILLSKESLVSGTLSFSIRNRDADGNLIDGTSIINTENKSEGLFIASVPKSMEEYCTSDLYIVPIVDYTYDSVRGLSGAYSRSPISIKGSSAGFIKSDTEPVGKYMDGTVWYNPVTKEFKTYVEGIGFTGSTSTMGFLQYQSSYTIPDDLDTPQDIIVPVGIDELQVGDILQVSYEGLLLVQGEHYSIDYAQHTITLLGFNANAGDVVGFTLTKIVESSDISDVTTLLTGHMNSVGSSTIRAHVKLTDSADPKLDQNSGVAATPKSVYDSTLLKDTTNNIQYKFGVANGLLYIEEV